MVRHLWLVLALAPLPAWGGTAFIYVTNSAGDSIHVIDPATNKVVQEIKGIEAAHGIAPSPDGARVYVSNEADTTLDVFDRTSGALIKKVPLSNHPNNIAVTKTGDRILVGIARAPGAVDVIDAATLTRTKSIPVNGRLHNVYVTPDGKFVVAGSIPGKKINVIDQKTEEIVWTLPTDEGVRPMAFDTNPDGSTKRIFVELSNFNGFITVDFATRKVVDKIAVPEAPAGEKVTEGLQGSPAHGLAITPDGKELAVLSKMNTRVYFYSLPDLKLAGSVKVGHHPDWLTFTPDGKRLYVANAGSNSVSVVDVATHKELTQIPVGQVPKRNTPAVLP